jgi:hypothetical protein
LGLVVLGLAFGCSGDGDDDKKAEGALPCNQSAAACKASFADSYEGTYTGDATGRVIFEVDSSGAIFGTATLSDGNSEGLLGEVNEYGKFTGEGSNGTVYTGQFDGKGGFSGTWKATDGTSGTFSGTGTKPPPVASGTGGNTGTGGSTGTGGFNGGIGGSPPGRSGFDPTVDEICDFIVMCDTTRAECESQVGAIQDLMAQYGCVAETNAFFQCGLDSQACEAPQCQPQFEAMDACATAAAGP